MKQHKITKSDKEQVIIKALMLKFKSELNKMQNKSFNHSLKKIRHRIIEFDKEINDIKNFNF